MATSNHSKRFNPTTLTEKVVPVLLIVLTVALLGVVVLVALSLMGIIPSA